MNIRRLHLATGFLAVAAIALLSGNAWAIYIGLGPSKDDWGLKYSVAVEDAGAGMVTVTFTLADEGRLKPIHAISVALLNKQNNQTSRQGSKTYSVKGRLELKPTADGKRVGQMQIPKDAVEHAILQVVTQRVDGKLQSPSAAYYDIPLAKHVKPEAATGIANRPTSPPDKKKK